jgi:HEPN domain-containing protein
VTRLNRSKDWHLQAQRDLEHAREAQVAGRHEWACFAARQAAEKAVRALHLWLNQDAWGHVVAKLLDELPINLPPELVEMGKVLDNFYVPARYPNGHAEGPPFAHYGILQSTQAIDYAGQILAFVTSTMA